MSLCCRKGNIVNTCKVKVTRVHCIHWQAKGCSASQSIKRHLGYAKGMKNSPLRKTGNVNGVGILFSGR